MPWFAVAVQLAACAAAAKAQPPVPAPSHGNVTLRVREPLGLTRTKWPVTTGVPFPRGQLRDPGAVTLRECGGPVIPLQTRVLSRWDDGSIRWLLADFPISLARRQEKVIDLLSGHASAPPMSVRVQEDSAGITVNTGPLHFAVPRSHFAIMDDVRLHGRTVLAGPLRPFLISDQGGEAQPPRTVSVRERGPLRAEIELRGQFATGFDYVVRLNAYAGQPFVRVLLTFEATGPVAFATLRQLAVEAPLPAADTQRYRIGIEHHPPVAGRLRKPGVTLVQDDNFGFRINDRRDAGHASGWTEVDGKGGGIAVAARFFWQEYPKGFQLEPGKLIYNLWAPEALPAQIGVGAATTHEFSLLFFDHRPPAQMIAALAEPLVATVEPSWVSRSLALPNAIDPVAGAAFLHRLAAAHRRVERRTAQEVWDEAAQVKCPPPGKERRRTGAFGMLNWGDWNFPGFHDNTKGCDAWGNLEYDLAQVYALAFAATGDPAYHDAMTAAARHFMDVDVIHAQPRQPKWIGMNHPKNPLHFSFALGGVDLGHTWTEGLLSYYYLTGDERALDAARGIADYLVRRIRAGIFGGNPRQWGWPQIALLAVYQATGDARYKDAASDYARRGMAAYPPTEIGNWKVGILADALADTHAITGSPDIARWLVPYAAAVTAKPGGDIRLYPAVAYVAQLTHNPQLAQAARDVLEKASLGNWAKPFTIAARTDFRILSLLAAEEFKSTPENRKVEGRKSSGGKAKR
jgi:PcRGLX-like N-terminal RIFT barrel domain/Beta-L-arabinofuranosidase, GH127 catalytic domain